MLTAEGSACFGAAHCLLLPLAHASSMGQGPPGLLETGLLLGALYPMVDREGLRGPAAEQRVVRGPVCSPFTHGQSLPCAAPGTGAVRTASLGARPLPTPGFCCSSCLEPRFVLFVLPRVGPSCWQGLYSASTRLCVPGAARIRSHTLVVGSLGDPRKGESSRARFSDAGSTETQAWSH